MRGSDSLPGWVTREQDLFSDWEPITAVQCPCCKGLDEAFSTRVCLSYIDIMTRELSAFFARAPIPFHGVTGWANGGDDTALAGCLRCGGAGVVPVDQDTEEGL